MDANRVVDGVWVGGWSAARDHRNEFDIIINCATDAPHYGDFQFHLVDGHNCDRDEFTRAAICAVEAIRSHKRVLIHCMAGMSRSLCVAALALTNTHGMTFDQALDACKKARSCEPVRPKCPHEALVTMARGMCESK